MNATHITTAEELKAAFFAAVAAGEVVLDNNYPAFFMAQLSNFADDLIEDGHMPAEVYGVLKNATRDDWYLDWCALNGTTPPTGACRLNGKPF